MQTYPTIKLVLLVIMFLALTLSLNGQYFGENSYNIQVSKQDKYYRDPVADFFKNPDNLEYFLSQFQHDADNRIVGGEDVDIHDYPWQVSMQLRPPYGAQHFCGGTILSEDWILTASHCLVFDDGSGGDLFLEPFHLRIRAGFTHMNNPSQGSHYNVAEIIMHPEYITDPNNHRFNIALVRLEEPINLSLDNYASVNIIKSEDTQEGMTDPGVMAQVSGWGALYLGGPSPNALQAVEVPIVDVSYTSYPPSMIFEDMIIAGEQGKDACHGDSGGPLVVDDGTGWYKVAGVYSFGIGCGSPGFPGVYSRVSYFEDWLIQHIGSPEIVVNPLELSVELMQGFDLNAELTISNLGDALLEFALYALPVYDNSMRQTKDYTLNVAAAHYDRYAVNDPLQHDPKQGPPQNDPLPDGNGKPDQSVEVHYDTGFNSSVGTNSAASFITAARFTAEELAAYYGSYEISAIKFHIRTGQFSTVQAKIWEGGSLGGPAQEIYSEDVTGEVLIEDWTIHELPELISMIPSEEYWFGYAIQATGGYPASVDAGPMVEDKGAWMFFNGIWSQLTELNPELNFNWNIRAILDPDPDPEFEWLSFEPTSGTIEPEGEQLIDIYFDATNLEVGHYQAQIAITNNAGDVIYVPVNMNVVKPTYMLNLATNPVDGGEVSGAGEFNFLEEVLVSASENEGYQFVNWTDVHNEEISNQHSFVFVMPANDVTLTANFEQMPTYSLVLSANPPGSASLSGGGNYYEGFEVNIIANAYEGYRFINWTDMYGNTLSEDAEFIYQMPDEDMSLTANFELTTNIIENETFEIIVYPNPALDVINIKANDLIQEVRLLNILGQPLIKACVNNQYHTLNIAKMPEGLYFIQIQTKNNVKTIRIKINNK